MGSSGLTSDGILAATCPAWVVRLDCKAKRETDEQEASAAQSGQPAIR
jgi:hypothetical protein